MTDSNISIPQEPINTKHCNKCGEEKPFSDFLLLKGRGYLGYKCFSCRQSESKEYYKSHTGIVSRVINNARKRCKNEYAHKGIRMLLSREDISVLWERDNADSLIKPSLDRIDNDGDYVLENCQFIELSDNVSKDTVKFRVAQRDISGNVIAIFDSCADAAKHIGVAKNSISQCAAGVYYSIGGYFWDRVDNDGNLIFPDMKREKGNNFKSIIQMDMEGVFIREWPSKKEAAESLGIDATSLSKSANGRQKSAGGYKWKYIQ